MPNYVKNIVTVSEETMNKIKEKYFKMGILSFEKIIPMPKRLHLIDGYITDASIYYTWSKKSEIERKEITKILKSYKVDFYANYWEKIKDCKKRGGFSEIEKFAKNYNPSDIEKELHINSLEELGDAYLENIKEYGCTTWYEWRIENWGTKWDVYDDFKSNKTTMTFETAWSIPEPIFEKLSEEFPNEFIEVKFADEDIYSNNNGKITYLDGLPTISNSLGEKFAKEVWNENIEKEKGIIEEMYD